MSTPEVVVLAGGTGGAKLARGMTEALAPERVVVVANTGDDIEIYGAHVSPDPDLVCFWLAGEIDARGWGLEGDTFAVMDALRALGTEVWFQLGDRDLAVTDANAVASALRGVGFTVLVASNQDRQAMSQALLAFDRSVERDDVAFFFFAGHGFEISGRALMKTMRAATCRFSMSTTTCTSCRGLGGRPRQGSSSF